MKRLSVIIYISLSSACKRITLCTYRIGDNIDDAAPRERNTNDWINNKKKNEWIQSRTNEIDLHHKKTYEMFWKIDNEELLIAINNERQALNRRFIRSIFFVRLRVLIPSAFCTQFSHFISVDSAYQAHNQWSSGKWISLGSLFVLRTNKENQQNRLTEIGLAWTSMGLNFAKSTLKWTAASLTDCSLQLKYPNQI